METGFTFQYYDELQLISFFPESSPCSGGTTIKLNIRGMQLDSSYTCIFGEDIDSLAKPVNSSFIECMSPRWDTPGETTLSVVSTDSSADEIATETKPFTFYQWPVFSEASPSSIYHGMSADIYVQDGPFLNSPSSKCRLGQHEIHAHWISDLEIMCRNESVHTSAIEPLTSKLPLAISTNGADFHDSSILLDVSPKECWPSHVGGTHSPTSVALSVSANGQEFSHYPIQFFYHPNGMSKVSAGIELPHTARISHISPAIGLPGTNVSVTGSGFNNLRDAVCTFGFKHVPIISVSNLSMICTAPWHAQFESVAFNVISNSTRSVSLPQFCTENPLQFPLHFLAHLFHLGLDYCLRLLTCLFIPSAPPSGMLLVARE